jgi:DNA polymerase I-like protein with 3'-5' exonuclease and polymerase domains
VGQSGQKLRDAVACAGIRPGDVAYTNAVRHHPIDEQGKDRTPTDEELEACNQWLQQDVREIQPRVILAVGKSAEAALDMFTPDALVLATWHPSYVLRTPRVSEEFRQAVWDAGIAAGVSRMPITLRPGGPPAPENPEPWYEAETGHWSASRLALDTETDTGSEEGFSSRERLVIAQLSDGTSARILSPQDARLYGLDTLHPFIHNAPFDLPLVGINPHDLDKYDDTMVMAYTFRHPEVGLKKVGPKITGIKMDPITTILGPAGPRQLKFSEALEREDPVEIWGIDNTRQTMPRGLAARVYAMKDAVVTARLGTHFLQEFEKEPALKQHYYEIDKPIIPILYDMQENGVYIDPAALPPVREELDRMREESTQELAEMMPGVNPGSPAQLREFLPSIGFEVAKETKTGLMSTSADDLLKTLGFEKYEQLEERIEFAPSPLEYMVYHILRLRQSGKFDKTYLQKCEAVAGDRLHGRFKQCVTHTNRLASEDLNLQNIPRRTELGMRIRRAFAAPRGFILVKSDLSQIEMRLAAHYTQEPVLLEGYRQGVDVHDMVREALGFAKDKEGRNRDIAKNTGFSMLYGAEADRVAETAHVTVPEAEAVLRLFRARLPRLTGLKELVLEQLWEEGYLETMLGWRGYFPDAWSPIYKEKLKAQREAVNFPIQGTAAGVLKKWLLFVYPELPRLGALALLTVHDEIVFQIEESGFNDLAVLLDEGIHQVGSDLGISVPLECETTWGFNWADQPKENKWHK